MREQSHKDEMSAAIRGDFERLRERGVAATLAPRDDDPQSLSTSADTLPDESEAGVGPPAEPDAQPVIEIPAATGVQPDDEQPDEQPDEQRDEQPDEQPDDPSGEPEPGVGAEVDALDEARGEEREGFFTRLFGR